MGGNTVVVVVVVVVLVAGAFNDPFPIIHTTKCFILFFLEHIEFVISVRGTSHEIYYYESIA